MTPLDVGIAGVLLLVVGGLAVHHRIWKAQRARIRTEADAFGGGLDGDDD